MYAFFARRRRSIAAFCMLASAAAVFPAVADAAPVNRRHHAATSPSFPNFFSRWRRMAEPQVQRGHRQRQRHAGGNSVSTACLPPALKSALAGVQSRFGPVTVVSAHRRGARIRGSGRTSLHASCQAVDFRPAPGTYAAVASHLRSTWHGGLGTYSAGHIHIDTGANYRWHQGGGAYAKATVRRRRR